MDEDDEEKVTAFVCECAGAFIQIIERVVKEGRNRLITDDLANLCP